MNLDLPALLDERTRTIHLGSDRGEQSFVLYWMRTAIRADENPALDVAKHLADQCQLPLLVFQQVGPSRDFDSDRHLTFVLQAVRDVQQHFRDAGIAYALHIVKQRDTPGPLAFLAKQASVVVTEDMPVDPYRCTLELLAEEITTPILSVDTACVVPMQLVEKAYTRAFQYRDATSVLLNERLHRQWPASTNNAVAFDLKRLDFPTVDLANEAIADIVAECDIDHSVGPVVDTIGGSTAGYCRWEQFKRQGLSRYARLRNDALVDGVSRLSSYLHYGMISPLRIAREAAAAGNAGAEKYLDELLVWRELAYNFCFYRRDHDQWSALPSWARESLSKHSSDTRETIYTWEQLSRASTKDALWNAAQKSLLMHGELHNNLRMTWGKALLGWTETPQQALRLLVDLNHRYALDGRDPASYGGLLWCLGQFDRPFKPEVPILGSVRPRTTLDHARRLDTLAYERKVSQPRHASTPSVAVVGAGLSGLMAARTLADHGLPVTVFDKSREAGGRMSTRRTEEGLCYDHGAQYFTVRDPTFSRYVASWVQQGVVASWPSLDASSPQRIVTLKAGQIGRESSSVVRYVGVPGMTAIGQHLAKDLDIQFEVRAESIEREGDRLRVLGADRRSLGSFDHVLLAMPAPQAAARVTAFPQLRQKLLNISMQPCWATMASFAEPLTDQWVGAFLHDSFLSWSTRNNTKPGRGSSTDDLILHASPDWTLEHLEQQPEQIADEMLSEFWKVSAIQPLTPLYIRAHRWRYAIPDASEAVGCIVDSDANLLVCGDWASGSRVEGAFLSGLSAAGRMLGTLVGEARQPGAQQLKLF